ncbi:histone-like nucleoid-structuring protein Lsr2 [Streptomyces sp. NPDC048342]|uniref:Lsr2 family DNA-binding protein n=1 Tax=unclassified Streptomyces TaxID=2593676 RepID=UPI003425A295
MTTDAYTLAAIELLKAGTPVADIAKQTGMSNGEIAALAETEGLTTAHARQTIQQLLEAMAWGEKHDTKKAQNLAARARTALTELVQLRKSEALVTAAEAEVDGLKQQLAQAEQKLRAAKAGKPVAVPAATPDGKSDREKIRAWARRNGHEVADRGALPQKVLDAYASRDQHQDQVPELRVAG